MASNEPNVNEILGYAVVISAEKITRNTLETIRKAWYKTTSPYGFAPLPEEANRLRNIAQNQTYITFKRIVGKYNYLYFIKMGILLYELNQEGNITRVDAIRKDIYDSRNKKSTYAGRKIIHLASTGFLLHVLDYLINKKDELNLSEYQVREEFEKILNLWRKISIPISHQDSKEKIVSDIKKAINSNEELIIIYASGGVTTKAQIIIAESIKKGIFKDKYLPWSKNNNLHGVPHFACICYAIDTFLASPLTE